MLLSITAGLNLTAYADTVNSDCGVGVTWSRDTCTGELTISGTGAMEDYSSPSDVLWHSYCVLIATVKINSGVTSIGNYAFEYCTSLTDVYYTGTEAQWNSNNSCKLHRNR